jgi:hypothetical protein
MSGGRLVPSGSARVYLWPWDVPLTGCCFRDPQTMHRGSILNCNDHDTACALSGRVMSNVFEASSTPVLNYLCPLSLFETVIKVDFPDYNNLFPHTFFKFSHPQGIREDNSGQQQDAYVLRLNLIPTLLPTMDSLLHAHTRLKLQR